MYRTLVSRLRLASVVSWILVLVQVEETTSRKTTFPFFFWPRFVERVVKYQSGKTDKTYGVPEAPCLSSEDDVLGRGVTPVRLDQTVGMGSGWKFLPHRSHGEGLEPQVLGSDWPYTSRSLPSVFRSTVQTLLGTSSLGYPSGRVKESVLSSGRSRDPGRPLIVYRRSVRPTPSTRPDSDRTVPVSEGNVYHHFLYQPLRVI